MFEGRSYTSVHYVQSSVYTSFMYLYIGLVCSKVEATLARRDPHSEVSSLRHLTIDVLILGP